MRARNVSLTRQRRQEWCWDWSKFKVLSFPNPGLKRTFGKPLQNSPSPERRVLDVSTGLWKNSEKQTCDVLCSPTVFPFGWGWLGLEGQISSQCSLSGAPQGALWFWQRAQLYPLWNAFTNILCSGTTGIKHRQPPGGPTSSPFTLQHGRWLQAELPETVVNSWHWKFPWSQLACKKGCLFFFPLKIMYFPGTVQMPQMRQMRDLFWPTYEKTFPFSARALRFSYTGHERSVSKEP